jgi:uncharacterized protein YndB with AHSA1/START domain
VQKVVISLLLVSLSAPAFAQQERPSAPRLSDSRIERLEEGEVITDVETDGQNNRAEVVCLIEAQPDEVWAVVMDYDRYESWFPDQIEAEVRVSGDPRTLYGETRVPVFRNRTYVFEDSAYERTVDGETVYVNTWEYVADSGNMDSSTGFWWVEPYDDERTLVRMVVHADLGMALPQAIINWGTRRILPGIAAGIQEQCDAN